MHISNFHHYSGGVWNHIYLGSYQQISQKEKTARETDSFLAGFLFFIFIYHIGFYIAKWVNRKSDLQAGTELCLTASFKEFIKYRSIAYPENLVDYNTDYKRVGVFLGHELFINRISIETQLGYYVYQPFKYDSSFYDRVGMKYYVSPKIFSGISLVTHGFLAEALEFIVGVRL